MESNITRNTLHRALTGFARSQRKDNRKEDFALIGADYRKHQNDSSYLQRFVNGLTDIITWGQYGVRTKWEIHDKAAKLREVYSVASDAILKHDPLADMAGYKKVSISFKVDQNEFTIMQYGSGGDVYLWENSNSARLENISLNQLRVAFLNEHIRQKKADNPGEVVDLSDLCLNGLDLTGVDLRNCKLPDLKHCDLNDAIFDETTTFAKRTYCIIGPEAYTRMQEYSTKPGMDQGLPVAVLEELSLKYRGDISDPKILFTSEDPSAAWLKGYYLWTHKMDEVNKIFNAIREGGGKVNLTNTDLGGFGEHLDFLDLTDADLTGAILEGTSWYYVTTNDVASATMKHKFKYQY